MKLYRLLFSLLSATMVFALSPPLASASVVVVTEDGPVKGVERVETSGPTLRTEAFLGIPFAAPPVGNLRWMPPQPHGKFQGLFQANNFGAFCTQAGPFGSEDCLTLNVFRPSEKSGQGNGKHQFNTDDEGHGLPVMVWIHGGANVGGGSFLYDPSPLVQNGGVIVVTINYRLGLLGFFAHPAIDSEGHANGNYGLMDQQFALKWVQRNISAFGGDPKRVTIFGESAGGEDVYCNLASPTAASLFQRAIAESGAYVEFQDYLDPLSIVPLAQAETSGTPLVRSGTALAAAVGCGSQTALCLRGVAASTLVSANPGTSYPFVDGSILTQNLTNAFASGHFNRVPVVSGSNHDEWRIFVAQQYDFAGSPLTDAGYPAAVAQLIGLPVANPFVQFLINVEYPLSNYPPPPGVASAPLALGALGSDEIFVCPARNADRLLSHYVPTYTYEFNDENAPDLFDPVPSFPLGAYHFSEVQYLFDFNERFASLDPFTADQRSLSDTMISYWTQFATKGDPNSDGEPHWPRYSAATDRFQSLVPPTPTVESTFDGDHKCSSLWNTF
jgi:para-nitrobenzyl esterase